MTPRCIEVVDELEATNPVFENLSLEQLLYACVKGVGFSDTRYVLDTLKEDLDKLGAPYKE